MFRRTLASSTGFQGSIMQIEGYVVEIMESDPPELIVESEGGRFFVALRPETRITLGDSQVGYGCLKPNGRVWVEGRKSSEKGMLSDLIRVLE